MQLFAAASAVSASVTAAHISNSSFFIVFASLFRSWVSSDGLRCGLRGSGEYDIILRIDKPPVANCGFVNKWKGQEK